MGPAKSPKKKQQDLSKFLSSSPTKKDTSKRSTTPPESSSPIKKAKKETNKQVEKNEDEEMKSSEESEGGLSESETETLIKLAEKQQKQHQDDAKLGEKIPYAKLAAVFEEIEKESSRLKMTAILSQFYLEILQQSTIDKLVKIVYLSINRLGPDYEPDLELGLGETILIKAISEGYGRSSSKIKEDFVRDGDLGIIASKSRSLQPTMFKPAPLDVDLVFNNLEEIAKSTGKDSQAKKVGIIKKMLSACNQTEAKFIIRSLAGKLRIGLADKTVIVALAQAFINYENKSNRRTDSSKVTEAEENFKEAFSRVPNYEVLLRTAYKYGVFELLDHCEITPGIPLKPMLAKAAKSIVEIADHFKDEEYTCEYKYDGMRAQVHVESNGKVHVYSRNSENMTATYPDLVSIIKEFTGGEKDVSFILDCEAVAWDRKEHKILPFQVLSSRKRKNVEEKDITVNICIFAFDLLFLDGKSILNKSLAERRQILYENFTPIEDKFQFATMKNLSSESEGLEVFLEQSIKDSCEGLMVKLLNGKESHYEPSKRSRNWLKLKKDYLDGVGDSLDLVVVGAYNGKGKRTGTYGGFLLASYNEDTGDLETCCKIGTGFSDDDLASLYKKLHPSEIKNPKSNFVYDTNNSNAKPDVWFEPSVLFEVLTADLSLSPVYKTGHQEFGKGISLRFPRYIRLRDDKSVEDATSSSMICEFYERQASVQK
ncbi:DNA ligase [Candida maltosa Xu316]|uniref:DNA ligase n=1 Tax=Candida maltosa (strain Xu316) TaxID=1245528 RepID=M3HD69_CANMX|nr:DNA ligase [Candida maltosa Xu316]